ncbi:flippase-like domain-containing protein [Dongia soli]|uniref:Flippase-like domain-containing protein n=1 Tax=Dongia soli TaxID=600628 RepID=A0ABU5E7A9_9PROT|nr:flippase-like domain-containing protein [Dongia soli]MDY0882207.1 flippase-like domain-containing protein [Dongia soli]
MKHLGKITAFAGLILAIWLFARDDFSNIVALLRQAGPGLLLASLIHVFPMALNAHAWRVILPGARRPGLASMLRIVWVREAVNGLLPVARIGGEVVSYRLLRRIGVRRSPAVASLTVDMALSVLSQLAFALLGVAFLQAQGAGSLAMQITLALAVLALLAIIFVAVQHGGLFERVMRVLNRLAAGRFEEAIGHSARIDRAVQAMYGRRRAIISCLFLQFAGWIAGAAEIWLALWFLGHPVGVIDAIIIEAVIQAVSSAAFLVPGALGVQEAAFMLIGATLGLGPAPALALAAARRLRDCVVFMPGLVSWQIAETEKLRQAQ